MKNIEVEIIFFILIKIKFKTNETQKNINFLQKYKGTIKLDIIKCDVP